MSKYRTWGVLPLVVIIGAAAAACGSSDHKTPVRPTKSVAVRKPSQQAQQLYLKVMRALYPNLADRSNAEVLALGDHACTGFRHEDSYDTVLAGLRTHALSEYDAIGVIVNATSPNDGLCADVHPTVMKDLTKGGTPIPDRT